APHLVRSSKDRQKLSGLSTLMLKIWAASAMVALKNRQAWKKMTTRLNRFDQQRMRRKWGISGGDHRELSEFLGGEQIPCGARRCVSGRAKSGSSGSTSHCWGSRPFGRGRVAGRSVLAAGLDSLEVASQGCQAIVASDEFAEGQGQAEQLGMTGPHVF